MLDEEILLKYKKEIDESIERLIKEYNLTDETEIADLSLTYKRNFIKGFHQGEARGREDEKLKIARDMLKNKIDINLISQITGISIHQLKNLT